MPQPEELDRYNKNPALFMSAWRQSDAHASFGAFLELEFVGVYFLPAASAPFVIVMYFQNCVWHIDQDKTAISGLV